MCAAVISSVNTTPSFFPNMFSILWRFLYSAGSCGIGTFRLALDGMQAVILRSARASRNQSAFLWWNVSRAAPP